MSRLFDDSTPDFMTLGSTPVTVAPFSWCCWVYSDVNNIDQTALSIADTDAANELLSAMMTTAEDPEFPQHFLLFYTTDAMPVLARHGRVEAAFRLAEFCVARDAVLALDVLILSSSFQSLRDGPRWDPIVAAGRAQLDETIEILQEARANGYLPRFLEQPFAELTARLGNENATATP